MSESTLTEAKQAPVSSNALPRNWSRVFITAVHPNVDDGKWPVKRTVGETLEVTAGVITDGHDLCAAELHYWHKDEDDVQTKTMVLHHNDEYRASFSTEKLGRYYYRVEAWVDRFGTWQNQFRRRVEGGETEDELLIELKVGLEILDQAIAAASGKDARTLKTAIKAFNNGDIDAAFNEELMPVVRRYAPRERAVESRTYEVVVDPEHARFCAWYEFFPRSASEKPGRHATLDDAARRLPRIKELGFDVVYLPPVHPIGEAFRKGKDNAPTAEPGDPGSPWAIGGKLADGSLGGHKSVHPDLGGIEAFDRFVKEAERLDLKVAIDIAFQASPDHPYVQEHPEWFNLRPDGSIRYAENPPKKYQDVYPLNFETEDQEGLWTELKSVFEFWINHGVRLFRVDNPHTKPLAFWHWCLSELREEHPDLVFLSEAFTRPKMMYQLAKLGFNNSYTYFTWRNTKEELTSYAKELFQTEVSEFFRPNFWPNTPDILHDYLVYGGRPAHIIRLVLAATLSSAYGLYGPPFEHVDNNQHPDREEYANNEKYEVRTWNWNDPDSLQPVIKRVNKIRHQHPALHHMRNIKCHPIDNSHMIAYSKQMGDDFILCVVNLDPQHTQEGWIELPLEELGFSEERPMGVHDLLGGERYVWHGSHNYVRLDPSELPAHIFELRPFA